MTNFQGYFTQRYISVAPTWTATGMSVSVTWTGDLNGDGKHDLILPGASYPNNGNIPQPGYVLFGDGQGNFSVAPETVFPNSSLTTVHPRKIIVSDLNQDGRPDIFIASHGYDTNPFPGEQNKLYLSRPDGTWADATSSLPQLSDFSHGASIGDINGDGLPDVYVNNVWGQSRLNPYILQNNGAGSLSIASGILPTAPNQLLDMYGLSGNRFTSSSIDDLNNDGRNDLILGSDGSPGSKNGSLVLWNAGSGFDQANITFLPSGHQNSHEFVALDTIAMDINNDGYKDLIFLSQTTSFQGTFIDVYLNKGNKAFVNNTSFVIGPLADHPQPGSSNFLQKFDVNNDGLIDVVLSQPSFGKFDGNSVFMLLNKGNGTFLPVKMSDLTSDQSLLEYGATPFMSDSGLSFIVPFSPDGTLKANELIATKALPKFAYGTAEIDLHGSRSQYIVSQSVNTITVTDNQSGRDGTQTLLDIQQRVKFSDGSLIFDVTPSSDNSLIYRLYQAAFARSPDEGGFRFWLGEHNNGLAFNDMSSQFLSSNEFKQKYGPNPTNAQYVDLLYQNVLGRQGEAGGVSYWNSELSSGHATREQVLIGFAGSQENVAKTAPNIDNGYWVL